MIFPDGEEGKIRTSEEAREAVFTLVNPRKRGMQVKAVKPIHGNGIAVETTTPEALKELVDNPKLRDAGLQTRTPTVKNPRMIIFDVPREMSENDILKSMRKQNAKVTEGMENDGDFSLCFRTGRKDSDETNWVAEVSPKLREKLLEANKVFLGWNACKVRDFLAVSRCFKCQGFGHIAKHCRHKEEVCSHCTEEGHGAKTCPKKTQSAVCVNCRRFGLKGGHAASSKECPAHRKALEKSVNRTVYHC